MTVPRIERVDLRGVDARRLGHSCVVDHLGRGAGLDAHRAERDLAGELVGCDLEHAPALAGCEHEPLAAASAADVHADAGRGHALQVRTERGLVERAVGGEGRDADGEDAGGTRPGDVGSQSARKVTGLWTPRPATTS